MGRFPDFRVVACARLPPAARGKSDIKCASAHRIQWRDRGLGPALRDVASFDAPPARSHARRAHAPGCHFPFTRLRGHPPAFRYSGVTVYILAQPPILAKIAMSTGVGPRIANSSSTQSGPPGNRKAVAALIEAQSLEIDTVSGATITTRAFLKSVGNALAK